MGFSQLIASSCSREAGADKARIYPANYAARPPMTRTNVLIRDTFSSREANGLSRCLSILHASSDPIVSNRYATAK